jgi:hypothetical protein
LHWRLADRIPRDTSGTQVFLGQEKLTLEIYRAQLPEVFRHSCPPQLFREV